MEHDCYSYRVRVKVDPATAETRVFARAAPMGAGPRKELL